MKESLKYLFSIVFVVIFVFLLFKFIIPKTNEFITDKLSVKVESVTEEERNSFQNELKNGTKYYYNLLNENEQEAYIALYTSYMTYDDSRVIGVDSKKLSDIHLCVIYDNPAIFWVDGQYEYIEYDGCCEIHPKYVLSPDEVKRIKQNDILPNINKILKRSNDYPTEYGREIVIHDYLCQLCSYDITTATNNKNGIYGVFTDGKTACQGYSFAFKLLLDKVGIYNYVVVGDMVDGSKTEPHMWNVVRINGENYYVDVTGDDNEDDFSHLYFNVNEDFIKNTHLNIKPSTNNCINLSQNYFRKNRTYIKSFKSFNNYTNQTVSILNNGFDEIEFIFENKTDYNKAKTCLSNDYDLFAYVENVVNKSKKKYLKDEINTSTIDDCNYIKIRFKEG